MNDKKKNLLSEVSNDIEYVHFCLSGLCETIVDFNLVGLDLAYINEMSEILMKDLKIVDNLLKEF